MAEMIRVQMTMGICRFKCATLSEIRMVAQEGAEYVLWAYPVVGPNVGKFIGLMQEFLGCCLYTLEDDLDALQVLCDAAQKQSMRLNVPLDVNITMNRTGMTPDWVVGAYRAEEKMSGVKICGLHCYDGHIHD